MLVPVYAIPSKISRASIIKWVINMFNKTPQRNFEWFEITFTKKMQSILSENKEDSLSWIRDLFVSLLFTMLSLLFQILDKGQNPQVLQLIFKWGTIISLILLVAWFIICIIRYNKKLKQIKTRIVPHSVKNYYSIDESVQLFDNDICNELVLSKSYIDLAMTASDPSLKEFYLIESLHYYFKSIRVFNVICNSNDLEDLFTTQSGIGKKINIIRLQNYLELIKCVKIDDSKLDADTIQHIKEYHNSYDIVKESFNQTLTLLKNKYSEIQRINTLPNDMVQVIQ